MESKSKIMLVGVCIFAVSVMTAFAVGSYDWYTDSDVDEAILYPSDGEPGEGDTSLEGIEGASDWYTMVYDTDMLDVETFDHADYPSTDDARDDVMAAELDGGQHIKTAESSGTFYSYIEETFDGNNVSEKKVGSLVFNVSDPATASLGGMMMAASTETKDMPDMFGDPPPAADYNAGVVGFNGTEWQAVPEPAGAILAFVGVCTVIYRRRRMRR